MFDIFKVYLLVYLSKFEMIIKFCERWHRIINDTSSPCDNVITW